ncbi:MAG: flagellar basal body-associated FliL family protein [Micavibrio sp.]
MADEQGQVDASLDGGGEPFGDEGKKKTGVILIVVVLFILAGLGAGLYFSGFLDKLLTKDDAVQEEVAQGAAKPASPQGDGAASGSVRFLKLPDMVVNLNSEDRAQRYLRLSVQLELKNDADLLAVEQVLPRVVDQFQTYLRELRVRDLRGSAGIYRLQIELLARVNQAAYPVEVQDVLFQEILIQ